MEEQQCCSICRESTGKLVHPCTCSYYHQKCLSEWFEKNPNNDNKCPTCKSELATKNNDSRNNVKEFIILGISIILLILLIVTLLIMFMPIVVCILSVVMFVLFLIFALPSTISLINHRFFDDNIVLTIISIIVLTIQFYIQFGFVLDKRVIDYFVRDYKKHDEEDRTKYIYTYIIIQATVFVAILLLNILPIDLGERIIISLNALIILLSSVLLIIMVSYPFFKEDRNNTVVFTDISPPPIVEV